MHGWHLLDYPSTLPEFSFDEESKTFAFDIENEHITWQLLHTQEQLSLGYKQDWTEQELVLWLDKRTQQIDIQQPILLGFLQRVITHLQQQRGFSLDLLVRAKFILQKVLLEKIKNYRQQAASTGFQTLLLDSPTVTTSFAFAFDFSQKNYAPNTHYRHSFKPKKHYFGLIGEVGTEEMQCVMAFEQLPQIKYWVRNLVGDSRNHFWLPTATDLFYPDFVAVLNDGRILVVEHKGDHLATNDDSKEKRLIGTKWQAASEGKVLFLMTEKKDSQGRSIIEQIRAKVLA